MLNHKNFMRIAQEIATWSKCVSRWVWAVIVKNTRILSTWYNWTPSWYINCCDYWKWEHTNEHHDWSDKYEIHAEMNALIWAARNWVSIDWADIYCTYEPCFHCTKNLIAAWIQNIYYLDKYKHHTWEEVEKFVKDNWKHIEQIKL